MEKHVANGLADTLLAGPAEAGAARARCARALGKNPRWLRALVYSLLKQFGSVWHWGSRENLIAAILAHRGFRGAWADKAPPKLHRYSLVSPHMAPRPARIAECGLPDLPTLGDLASWLEITPRQLDWLAHLGHWRKDAQSRPLDHYVYLWAPKRRGGHRLLEIPKPELRAIQRRILHELLQKVPVHEAVHGFRPGHSCLTNAAVHIGQAVVIRMDLKDFFLNVRSARVHALFRTLGYPKQVSHTLAGLTTNRVPAEVFARGRCADHEGDRPRDDWITRKRYQDFHLPQGAPSSPALANLCAFRLDVRLLGLARTLGARYTRYADDLTFSGGAKLARAVDWMLSAIGAIALDEGFAINYRKTQVMRRAARQTVTGVVVNEKPNLPRDTYEVLKAVLNNCRKHGPSRQNRAAHPDFRGHLAGRIAHANSINPERGLRLQRLFEHIVWDGASA